MCWLGVGWVGGVGGAAYTELRPGDKPSGGKDGGSALGSDDDERPASPGRASSIPAISLPKLSEADLATAFRTSRASKYAHTGWPVSGQLGNFCTLYTPLLDELPSNCEQTPKSAKAAHLPTHRPAS